MDDGGQVLPSNMEVANEELKLPSAIWARYVYVEEKPDPFRESLPVVVLGLDYTAVRGDHICTFTFLASEADFDEAETNEKSDTNVTCFQTPKCRHYVGPSSGHFGYRAGAGTGS